MFDKLNIFDTRFFLWLNSFHSPFWDQLMWHISGVAEWIPFYMLIVGYIIYRYKKQSLLILAGVIVAVTLADQLGVHAFKNVFERLRPSHNPEIESVVHTVNNYRGGLYGFVSNHAANTFSLATFLALVLRNRYIGLLLYSWALLVSYSRIYLGVHYPGDIICGAILGIIVGWLVWIVYTQLKTKKAVNG